MKKKKDLLSRVTEIEESDVESVTDDSISDRDDEEEKNKDLDLSDDDDSDAIKSDIYPIEILDGGNT